MLVLLQAADGVLQCDVLDLLSCARVLSACECVVVCGVPRVWWWWGAGGHYSPSLHYTHPPTHPQAAAAGAAAAVHVRQLLLLPANRTLPY